MKDALPFTSRLQEHNELAQTSK